MDSRLEHLLKNTPNIYGNMFTVLIVRLLSLLIGLTLIIIGACLVVAPLFQFSIIDFVLGEDFLKLETGARESIERISEIVGFIAILTGVILMFLRHVAGYVIVRNAYIFDLKEWYNEELAKREEAKAKEAEKAQN